MKIEKNDKINPIKTDGPKMRRLIIETDGNRIGIVTNETTGLLELKAILTELLTNLR